MRDSPSMMGRRWSRPGRPIALLVLTGVAGVAVFFGHLGSPSERPGSWSTAPRLSVGLEEHTATLLKNGRVLITGGNDGEAHALASAEVYDPSKNAWLAAGQMSTPRLDHAATLLANGDVLVTGGALNGDPLSALDTAEVYDPATNTWRTVAPMPSRRTRQSAVLLADGRVLVVGGASYTLENGGLLMSPPAEEDIFDPRRGAWSMTGPMTTSHLFPSVALLHDGRVLVAGGQTLSSEIYDPKRNAWSAAATMPKACDAATITVLASGDVLLVGGEGQLSGVPYPYSVAPVACTERYDPAHDRWSVLQPLPAPRIQHTATLLGDGRVLVVGDGLPGTSAAEVYDPASNLWTAVSQPTRRYDQTATRLPDGRVLIVGGYPFDSLESALLYDPAGGSVPLNPLAVTLWSVAAVIVLLVLARPWWRPRLRAWYSRQRSEDWVS